MGAFTTTFELFSATKGKQTTVSKNFAKNVTDEEAYRNILLPKQEEHPEDQKHK